MPVLLVGGVELVAVVGAIAALLAVIALWVLLRPATWTLQQFPWPADLIGTTINSWLKDTMRFFIGFFDSMADGAAHLFFMLGTGVWQLLYAGIAVIGDAKTWAVQAYQLAATGLAAAETYALTLYHRAVAYALHEATVVLHDAEGLFNTAEADISKAEKAAVAAAEAFAVTEATAVLHEAQHLYNVLNADILNVEHVLNGEIDKVLAAAEAGVATAEAEIKALGADLVNVGNQVLAEAEQYTNAALAGLGVAGVAATLTGILSRVGVLEAEATTCLEPLCDTVTPNASQLGKLGTFLKGLEALGVDALVALMFTEMVTDPKAVAGTVTAVMGDVADPIITGVRDLIGV